MAKNVDQLGELQRSILEAVWELGQATVHDVRDKLHTKKLAYTTILTALQRLEKAGLIKHRKQGKSYAYLATASREEAGAHSVRRLVESTFGGDKLLMLQHLMENDPMSDEELSKLHQMIAKKRRERADVG